MGSDEVLGSSTYPYEGSRSVTLTIELPPGDYVVHVRPYAYLPLRAALTSSPTRCG